MPQRAFPTAPQMAAQPGFNQSLRYPAPPQAGVPANPQFTTPGNPPFAGQPASFSPAAVGVPPQPVEFQRGQIIARVGDKTIFYGDIAPTVSLVLEPVLARARSPEERAGMEAGRKVLLRVVLRQTVQTKMLLCEFERSIPEKAKDNAKEFAKTKAIMDKKIRAAFEKTLDQCREQLSDAKPEKTQKLLLDQLNILVGMQVVDAKSDPAQKLLVQEPTVMRLALLMKDRKLESLGELDQELRQLGTTLDAQARDFGESKLGMDAVGRQITRNPEVTHQEMLDYYQKHADEFAVTAKASFEILSVKFSNYRDRTEAWNAIAGMGDAVYLGGVPFAAVARKHSQEPRASEGGLYEKVTQGSLASTTIDQAVFSLDVGKLSQIIADDTGFHIIRVKERNQAGYIPFADAQKDIRLAIKRQKQNAEQQKILAELAEKTKVWTIYDPPAEVASRPPGGT
jgi:parvulin-like peptidyl-prolyl isomerase